MINTLAVLGGIGMGVYALVWFFTPTARVIKRRIKNGPTR
jgi:hypothetical protein